MGPAPLIHERTPHILVQTPIHAANARCGNRKLAFVTKQHMVAHGVGAVDVGVRLRDELHVVGPEEAVGARVAVAERADPCEV